MSRAYIRFLTIEDYLGYLRAHNLKETHLELSWEQSKGSRDDILFLAIASANVSDKIAQCTIFLGKESSLSLIEKNESKNAGTNAKIKDQFESIQSNLQLTGWVVFPGSWSFTD
jgi:hypothetical protein